MTDLRTLLSEALSDDATLSSTFEIEDILLLIDDINKKVDYYKELKKHRVQSIDSKVADLTEREAALRRVILNTMQKLGEKSLDFPDIGRVSRRKPKPTVVVEDQDQVIAFLDKKGRKDDVVKVPPPVIDKRKLNGIVSELDKLGEDIPGVAKVAGNESISITFEKPKDVVPASTEAAAPVEDLNLDELDTLAI